ncbi:hypothetical protein A1QO_03920 [Vibrio genomosp. F10 str. ZF-129]|uniref:Uncharacterized protein n=1 Tax=Vibrio genomosp. F10 str. ZF-129 TaxID=1187848 RepID=A0A1E5BIL2_9VIBR|nr:hypothetical protein [Vibrio genomosp. F10]OEE37258.1 hypothetical protein A1QO_03920 [Vibrio genomosp. F10 str. ZF-129]
MYLIENHKKNTQELLDKVRVIFDSEEKGLDDELLLMLTDGLFGCLASSEQVIDVSDYFHHHETIIANRLNATFSQGKAAVLLSKLENVCTIYTEPVPLSSID